MAANTNTLQAFRALLRDRQGGALTYASTGYYSENLPIYQSAAQVPPGHKPFTISIYQSDTNTDLISFSLIINPSDLNIGNVSISSDAYTRGGWVSTIWGNQQPTLSSNGTSAGFYYTPQDPTGLTNIKRKDSISFINMLNLMSTFKNNGANFLQDSSEEDIFKSGYNRIINVMDTVKISYDGTEFLGEFVSFTLDESAEKPYSLDYSFEFVIHGISADAPYIEGHVKTEQYDPTSPITISIQGEEEDLQSSIINAQYIIDSAGLRESIISDEERRAAAYRQGEEAVRRLVSGRSNISGGFTPTTITTEQDALIEEAANRLGIEDPDWLRDLIWFESKNDVNAKNPYSTAVGLLQFTDIGVQGLGYSTSAELYADNPTFEQQMNQVERYLEQYRPFEGQDQQYLYMSVFYPSYRNSSTSTTFPSNVRDVNPGIETVQDYLNYVNRGAAGRPAPASPSSSGFSATPTADEDE